MVLSLIGTPFIIIPADISSAAFIIIPTDISSAATTTVSVNKDYVKTTPLTIEATPVNYNAMFTDRTGNNSLNSTFNNTQESLNVIRNLTQQGFQTPSHLTEKALVATMPTTTQQGISPIHRTFKTPHNKNITFRLTTMQSTVNPSGPRKRII